MQIVNPIFPLNEYIPDGEPHVFGDRVYLFGSHDMEGGNEYCMLDYVCYSASVYNLKEWKYEGVIYQADRDPAYGENMKYMYAPDVVQGPDGRYYLYYCLLGQHLIKVAVCDTPAGDYQYYGIVHGENGKPLTRFIPGDPGVINDDGRIYLYYGWSLALPPEHKTALPMTEESPMYENMIQLQMMMFDKSREEVIGEKEGVMGANVVELKEDMLTTITEPKRIVPGQFNASGTGFEGHAFYEASSIRKIGNTYYFIYSCEQNNQLCYATSQYPDKEFEYGGVIISNGDLEYCGRTTADVINLCGTNHGSIEYINGRWYVFYHRLTHGTDYSRQACAEEIVILPDGRIPQVEVTTQGLNGGPLEANGVYEASIACNITNGKMPNIQFQQEKVANDVPCVTHEGEEHFITNIKDGTTVGYKYFDFQGQYQLSVVTKGSGKGKLVVSDDETELGVFDIEAFEEWKTSTILIGLEGVKPLYFKFYGEGVLDIRSFSLFSV